MLVGVKSFVVAAAVAAALVASPSRVFAQAADLFSPATPAETLGANARPISGSSREAVLSLNAAALSSSAPVRVRLFPGVEATFAPTGSEAAYGGGSVWTGATEDGSATLVLSDGGVVGSVTIGARSFKIERVRGRLHKVAEIDARALPSEGPLLPAPEAAPAPSPRATPEPERGGKTTIRILVAYTARAAAASSNITSDINLAISLANQAYATASAQIALKLAGTIAVSNYDELTAGFAQVLYDVTDNTTPFQPVNQQRDALKADLVAVLQEGTQYCGIAWYIASPSAATANRGFSTTARTCITNQSFTHELGHNMGLNHDRYAYTLQTGATPPPSEYNFGFSRISKLKRSIMAYNNECADAGVFCQRINTFSEPGEIVDGLPFGVKQGKPKAADSARRLKETRAGVAAYR